jgi:diadenosine tetraphosphate (Ap4A) HIT family hydrolase
MYFHAAIKDLVVYYALNFSKPMERIMTTISQQRIEAARTGLDPALICQISCGWVFLCGMQYLRGYCILQADPEVESINSLEPAQQAEFLCAMVMVGDAIMEVTGAYRINYAIMGNSEPVLHAHIVPRYLSEPDDMRIIGPWSYPNMSDDSTRFNPTRDAQLILDLRTSIHQRVKALK